jgi:hypothetical protein
MSISKTENSKLPEELENLLLKQMEYTEQIRECRLCKHYIRIDGEIDREFVDLCSINFIGHVKVIPAGRCLQ